MSVATLPRHLQTKLDVLARRLHRLRLLRGISGVVLAIATVAGIALALDAWLELPSGARWLLFACWLGATAVAAWRGLVRPLRRPVTAAGLAAAVEEEYPRLGERLMSAVELAESDVSSGSPGFVHLLVRETDQKTRTLDFGRAAPPHAAEWLTAAAVAAVLVLAAPIVFVPEYYLGLGRRLLMPWDRRPAIIPFTIDTAPGDGYAARGRPLTIAVGLRPTRDGAVVPDVCTLILTGEDGKPLRLRVPAAGRPHEFAFRIDEVKGDYRYFVQAGSLESRTHVIAAVDPVELAGGPTATLTPPAYAKSLAPQTVEGPADLAVLEHGRVAIDCRFDHPAEAATLIVTPTAGADMTPKRRPLTLAEDRRSGRIELAALAGARLRLELDAGHGITTVTPEQTLTVSPDRPPEFRRVSGLPEHGSARPNDALALDLSVADDLTVATVEVEYRVNDGPVQREPVALEGIGSPIAAGRAEFKLSAKAKDGDKLFVRLRAADNRSVPEANVGPNVVTYPAGDRWCELTVSASADSVRQQEITAKRDDIEKRLREMIAEVDRAVRRTYALHQNVEQGRSTADEQSRELHGLADGQAALSTKLEELARDAGVAGLKPLADQMQAINDQEFRQAAEAFRDAGQAADQGRVAPLRRADAALTEARTKLEALLQENQQLADLRLDEVMLNDLADRERDLAEQAQKADTPGEREKLAKEQKELADELKRLTEMDDRLREAIEAARADDARKLAEQARQLAQAERDLDAKLAEAERQRNAARLADLARRQQQLAKEAEQMARRTQSAAKTAKAEPLDAQPAARAADDLRSGDADAAQQRQGQSARELERLADDLQRAVDSAKDPREAARQLSQLQGENLKRLDRPAEKALARQQQESIQKAIGNLRVPEDNTAARRDRQQAAELAAEAARALNRDDAANAGFRMDQAKDALDRLANDLPGTDGRLRRAREELTRLRDAQEEVSRQADKAARAAEKGDRQKAADERAEAARKQADVAERLSKLDAPGQDARRDRAAHAAARAQDDLQNPGSPDVAASQQDARRALERLAEALAGQTPADEKARELARQERELADAAAKAAGNPATQRDLQPRQEKVAQDVQGLRATEAPVRQGDAAQAAIRANAALRDKPGDPATPQKLRDAADKLDQLADQLAGRETEAQRADRLARRQQAAADKPPANPIDTRRQTNQIASEAQQVRAGEAAAAEKRQATDALARAQRTAPGTPENAQAQKDAAEALRRLADQMGRTPPAAADKDTPKPDDLARRQRDLARETDATGRQSRPQSLQQLADQQRQLRQQANRLPTEQAPKAVQQAREAMQQAEQALARQDAAQARDRQQQAAEALDRAAKQAAKSPPVGPSDRTQPDGMPTPDQVAQARDLAKRQRDFQDQVRQEAASSRPDEGEQEAANRQQQDMARRAAELAKSLDRSAEKMPNDQSRQAGRSAADAARQGERALEQAQGNDPGQSKQARKQAAEALDQAAGQAEQAAKASEPGRRRASPNGRPQDAPAQAGEQIQNAQGQMGQAQQQLGQGQPGQAGGSMQRAADALRQAAKQIGQGGEQNGPREGADRPAESATAGRGNPTAAELPKDLQKYAGKKWGELPGELRTRIVQEMKAQYGDDYARVIKLYFEQIAENNGKK